MSAVTPAEEKVDCNVSPSLPAVRPDKLKTAKALAEKAVKMQKVFTVLGRYPVIRAGLRARGWVERLLPNTGQGNSAHQGDKEKDEDGGNVGADNAAEIKGRGDDGTEEENHSDIYSLLSRFVRNERTYFYWTPRNDSIDWRTLRPDQVTNHYTNTGIFTTKVGLCVNLRNLKWFDTADHDTFFPRCYRLGAEDERHAFIDDFRRTACSSLLKHVVETSTRTNGAQEEKGTTESNAQGQTKHSTFRIAGVISTALHRCQEFLNILAHSDIDVTEKTIAAVEEKQWNHFLQNYYMVVHKGASIRGSAEFVSRCQAMLVQMQDVCPQLDVDGVNNIWIIKPGAMSRGRGIVCMNRLEDILALVDSDRAIVKDSKWVVQKYLERPLLVKGTKFDVRQWFLVTDWNPLTVWFYRECYLRFSTQPYSTKNLDSSVHLCNNSIQKHLQPSRERHPGVPKDNMWSCTDFKKFLQQQGRGSKWETLVVPGMQQAVVHTLQTAQDKVEHRKASFELYGADFMLGNDLRPWLLEVNASPTMACSSVVTSRLCPSVQLDTLRVVLDRRNNPNAYTGGFQLIYKQPAVEPPQFVGVNLFVEGTHIRRPKLRNRRQRLPSARPCLTQSSRVHPSSEQSEMITEMPASVRQSKLHERIEECKRLQEKRQPTPPSPKRDQQERTEVHSVNVVFEQRVIESHNESKKKNQCLGQGRGGSGVPPALRNFSCKRPTHPRSTTHHVCKTPLKRNHGVNLWKSFLPRTFSETCYRPCTWATSFTRLKSLPPNILTIYQKPSMETFQIESSYRFHVQRFKQTMSRHCAG
uniref:tubulin monoglycylase TTLL3-like n=1 Tax=Doryrhamphus excisus TaxID=161450 RepID=UPI0025ADA912|nr:tubulin monoglycylase TTLL3-like [Doryrhamphus excisus]